MSKMVYDNSLMKSAQSQLSPNGKRSHHNALERQRRDVLKESYIKLFTVIPKGEKRADSRIIILEQAAAHIQYLRHVLKEYRKMHGKVKKEIQMLKQLLETLEMFVAQFEEDDFNSDEEDKDSMTPEKSELIQQILKLCECPVGAEGLQIEDEEEFEEYRKNKGMLEKNGHLMRLNGFKDDEDQVRKISIDIDDDEEDEDEEDEEDEADEEDESNESNEDNEDEEDEEEQEEHEYIGVQSNINYRASNFQHGSSHKRFKYE